MFKLRLFTFRGHETVWLSGGSADFAVLIEALDRLASSGSDRIALASITQVEDPDGVALELSTASGNRAAARHVWRCIGDRHQRESLERLQRGEAADEFLPLEPAPTQLLAERWEEG